MWDLARLELVAHAQNAQAWLVVAESARAFNDLVAHPRFQGHPKRIGSDPILPYGKPGTGRLRLNPPAKSRREMLRQAFEHYHGVELIERICTTGFSPHLEEPLSKGYMAYLSRIDLCGDITRFLPEIVCKEMV